MRQISVVIAFIVMLSGCQVSPGHGNMLSSGINGTGGQLYVSTPNSILHFINAENISGNVAPASAISGPDTLLSAPQHIFLDTADDRLYVANQGGGSILVFDKVSALNGDVIPTRVISGNATLLMAPLDVALDAVNNLLYVADGTSILVFAGASTANGNVPPVRNINIGIAMGGLLVDTSANQLYFSDPGNNVVDRLDGASSQNGPAIVDGSIAGAKTQLSQPRGLSLSPFGRLIVGNSSPSASITAYLNAATAPGNVAPVAEIAGSNTLLQFPGQITLNSASSELFVLDSLRGSILIFADIDTANGNISPARTISGPATGFTANAVNGLAIDFTR
jgi:hypothetical protein